MRNVLTILLAWLGLAGISENIVEWQKWFQVGILTHWTAVKTTPLELLPFPMPGWLIDYSVIGVMLVKSFLAQIPPETVRDLPDLKAARDRHPDHSDLMLRWMAVGGYIAIGLMLLFKVLLWPLHLLFELRRAMAGTAESKNMLRHFGFLLASFIPFLFLCSNIINGFSGQS